MAKKQLVKDHDKFIVRLPPGMRDRIKDKAERAGMSMNDAVVWALESQFPAPVTLEERLEDLATMVSFLKDSNDTYKGVEGLIEKIDATLFDIIFNKIGTSPQFRRMVEERHNEWQEKRAEEYNEKHQSPFEDPAPDDDLPY